MSDEDWGIPLKTRGNIECDDAVGLTNWPRITSYIFLVVVIHCYHDLTSGLFVNATYRDFRVKQEDLVLEGRLISIKNSPLTVIVLLKWLFLSHLRALQSEKSE